MASVIESLVIQGCNPATRPATADPPTKRSRDQRAVSSARTFHHPSSATKSLKLKHRQQERERLMKEQALPQQLLTISGQGSGTFGVPEGVKDIEGQESPRTMQGEMVLQGVMTPIVKKMEYLALVRHARQGMSSIDMDQTDPPPTPVSPKELFIIEGRKVTNKPSVNMLTRKPGDSFNKKTKYFVDSMLRTQASYSVTEFSFGKETPEGHVDQYKMFQSRESRGGPRSVRSVRSDTATSHRSLQLPALTRAISSEPGPISEYEQRIANSNRSKIAFAQEDMSQCTSDDEQVNDEVELILNRVRRPRSIKMKTEARDGTGDQLRACLNIEGQGELGSPRVEMTKWTPGKLAAQNKSLKSQDTLLFRRQKLMEKKNEVEQAKYRFSSVKSYLDFNKIMKPEWQADPATTAHPHHHILVNGKLHKGHTGVKRGQCDSSSLIFDLDEYFKVKTPRFDARPAFHRSVSSLRGFGQRTTAENDGTDKESDIHRVETLEELDDGDTVSQDDCQGVRRTPRGPIVAVPSADSDHWNENMTT